MKIFINKTKYLIQTIAKTKSLIACFIVWLAVVFFSYTLSAWQIGEIETDWDKYRDEKLHKILSSVQQQFCEMELNSFRMLEKLLDQTSLIEDITYWNPKKSPSSLFKQLIDFKFSEDLNPRGIGIYNYNRECIAWRNCDFNPAPHLLDECLNGERFSAVVKSGRGVFVVLCTFLPIPHPKLQEYVGVAVSFLPLDTNYPLSTRYIKSQSFAQKMFEQYELKEITIQYGNEPSTGVALKDSLQGNLESVHRKPLGKVTIVSVSKDVTIHRIKKRLSAIHEIATAFCLLFIGLFIIGNIYSRTMSSNLKCMVILALLWSIRYAFSLLNFPNQILPDFFEKPDVFHSQIFGRWSDSLGNLLTTAIIFFLGAFFWSKWMKPIPSPARNPYRWIVLAMGTVCLAGLFAFFSHCFYVSVCSIVENANFPLFNFNNALPTLQILIVYWAVFLIGIGILFLYVWFIRNLALWWNIRRKFLFSVTVLLFFLPTVVSSSLLADAPVTLYVANSTFMICAACLSLFSFPGQGSLRLVVLLMIVGVSIYPILQYRTDQKMQTLVEDRAEEFHEPFARDMVERSLDIFERDEELAKAVEDGKTDIAFLLWAKSPLSGRLDNLDLLVYQWCDDDMLQKPPLSTFSLNMPNPIWYQPLRRQLHLKQRQLIQYLPGYGEGKNLLFYMGGLPIRNRQNKPVGFIVLFTRYAQMAQTLPLPEVFSKEAPFPMSPLLIAYYDGKTMYDTNNPYLPKNVSLPASLVEYVQDQQNTIWTMEWMDGRRYRKFYFPRIIKRQIAHGDGTSEIITEKNIVMLGYALPSLWSRIFYFLQFYLAGLLLLLPPFLVGKLLLFLYEKRLSLSRPIVTFEQKILLSFLFISGIPVVTMGILTEQKAVRQIWEGYGRNLTEYLENAERTINEDTCLPIVPEEITPRMPDDSFCQNWGERNMRMLNIYLSSPPFLLATNRRELFQTELLPKRVSGKVFYQLVLLRKDICITLESLADYTFVVGYKALYSPMDKRQIVGVFSIPMLYNQTEVRREITEIVTTTFTVYAAIFLLVMSTGIVLAHQITRPLAKLIRGIHRVSAGELDFDIPVGSQDEFGQLVESFNRMTKDLKASREKLVQAEKDAAWREMARQIAHEIKNPLTPMKLSAQHIERAYRDRAKSFDKILEKGISAIIDAIDSLSKTASTFSEFARFVKPDLVSYSIYPILQECLNLCSHYDQQNIQIQSTISEDLPNVVTDPHQLKRVIINILTNAVQAIAHDHGLVVLMCKQDESGKKRVIISIQDNGCGIPEAAKSHLFEPNFSTKTHGSGLGLAICKRAMDQMGGEIGIESEEGKGTTVILSLPSL